MRFDMLLGNYEKTVWNILLAAMALVTLWFTGSALYHSYKYFSLNASTQVTAFQWAAKEMSSDRFHLEVEYEFQLEGKKYYGNTVLDDPVFRNGWAAEQEIPKLASKPWTVWYSSSKPQYSTLQKYFPLKECVSSLLLWGVLLYFIWLRYYYVARFYGKENERGSLEK